ncbi:endo-1,4 beta-D-xylanase [Halenospora varia]|nr:endo-1,4 beta-D-xylanase [Halenospora varia]
MYLPSLLPLLSLAAASPVVHLNEVGSLDAAMKSLGKKYWGVATDKPLLLNSNNSLITQNYFGQVTPQNSMKWDVTEASPNTFNFANSDNFVSWASEHNKLIRGHNLLWHAQLPNWVGTLNKEALTQAMMNHITTVVSHYKGQVYAWDVLYEVLDQEGNLDPNKPFAKTIGPTFVPLAFAAARKADPDTKLYITEYDMDGPESKKALGMARLVRGWLEAGVEIDGIGTEAHLNAGKASGVAGALEVLASSGVEEVAIAELDIVESAKHAEEYVAVAKACIEQAKCVGITSWGVRDVDSWRPMKNPLLFDGQYKPKAVYNAVYNYLREEARTRAHG